MVCDPRHIFGLTKDTCFKLVGYSYWFNDMKKAGESKKQVVNLVDSSTDAVKDSFTPELSAMIYQFMK